MPEMMSLACRLQWPLILRPWRCATMFATAGNTCRCLENLEVKCKYLENSWNDSTDNSMKHFETALQQYFISVVLTFTRVTRVCVVLAHNLVKLAPCGMQYDLYYGSSNGPVHSSITYAGSYVTADSKQFQTIPNNSKQFQTIPNNSKQFQTIPNNSKQFQTIPNLPATPQLVDLEDSSVTLRERDTMWQIRLPLSLLGELLRCLCKGSESWQSAFQRFPHKKSLDGERQGSVDTGWLESNHIKLWRLFVSFCYKAEVLDLHRGSSRTIPCMYIIYSGLLVKPGYASVSACVTPAVFEQKHRMSRVQQRVTRSDHNPPRERCLTHTSLVKLATYTRLQNVAWRRRQMNANDAMRQILSIWYFTIRGK